MRVLLDTDVMIDVLRQFAPAVIWLAALGDAEIVLPGYVVLELIQGCQNKPQQIQLEHTLRSCQIIWPTATACQQALATFSQFHLSHNIGFIDALIAHTALENNLPLHTFNQKHYGVLLKLVTIQPY